MNYLNYLIFENWRRYEENNINDVKKNIQLCNVTTIKIISTVNSNINKQITAKK